MFKTIDFNDLHDVNDSEGIVMTGVLFEYIEEELDQVTGFFHEIGLIPSESKVTDLRRITENVLGDEGRVDVLICFTPCSPNPMARLRYGSDLKWVSDFVVNFADDYITG